MMSTRRMRSLFAGCCLAGVAGVLSTGQPARAADAVGSLADSYNRTGRALFVHLAGASGNVVLSPYSISQAMTLARLGARGETEREMAQALALRGTGRPALVEAVRRLQDTVEREGSAGGNVLRLATALFLTRHGALVAPSYKALVQKAAAAGVFPKATLAEINDWVREKTDGRIARILERLHPYSVCVLVNAVSLKAAWEGQFSPRQTRERAFRLSREQSVQVPMMHRDGSYRIVRAHTFDAIALPYKGGRLALVVILPMSVSGTFPLAQLLGENTLVAILKGLASAEPERMRLAMPRFKISFEADLIPPFRALGLTRPFDKDRADFTGISESAREQDRIHITQVRHKAVIDVHEAGTDAAAATAVEFGLRSGPPPRRHVTIDRPFVFYLVEEVTGAVLFMGRVVDPRGK
ncbi:MAG: serpin family protein [Hyphomicrobiaceae bacterium]